MSDALHAPITRTRGVVALASAVAFATQVAFALLMVRVFTPEEVGEFSVISQIGFFWMTLALAQAPLGVLANHGLPAHQATQQAWRASMWRGGLLLPVAAVAVWFSHLPLWYALVWALLLAVGQLGWQLAQSLSLRAGTAWQQAAVRVLPPLTALLCALASAVAEAAFDGHGPTLLISACLGYAVGAAWLLPAWRRNHASETTLNHAPPPSDPRSATLRMAHSLVDALLATALIVVWQRTYGAQETGWMSALLRVLGFLPAVVHMAWAQVTLARGPGQTLQASSLSWWLGLGAFASVGAAGVLCATALHLGWLDARWQGVWGYIAPLVLWQGCACLAAAFSHRPFQTASAHAYSWACMALSGLQALALLAPLAWGDSGDALSHMAVFAGVSSLGLLGLTVWMSKLDSRSTEL